MARRTAPNLRPTRSTVQLAIRGAMENQAPRDFVERLEQLEAIDG